MHIGVRLSFGPLIGQNWRLNLGNFSLIYIVNSKSCRHYSSKTVRRSILIFIYVIPNILKLCTLVSACPSARVFGPKLTSELTPFSTSYLGHIVLAFTNALLYVTGISFLRNHFVSLTLRPGGAYVFRPDTFLGYLETLRSCAHFVCLEYVRNIPLYLIISAGYITVLGQSCWYYAL